MNSETGEIRRFLNAEEARKNGFNIPLTDPVAAELELLDINARLRRAHELNLMPPPTPPTTYLKRGEQKIGCKVFKKRDRVSRILLIPLLLMLLLSSFALAAPDPIGSTLTVQASRRFTSNPAGYRTTSPIRSPLMVNSDGYVRVMLCPTDMDGKVETWLSPVRKDLSFRGPTGAMVTRRARSPLLYTLDPLTLKEVLVSPTWVCNASAGTSSPLGAGWGNMVPLGTFNVLEIGDDIIASYGGDINDKVRFNKFTGERVAFSTSTGSNWSGVLSLEPDGSIKNWGTANYWTVLQPATKVSAGAAAYTVNPTGSGYSIQREEAGKVAVIPINVGFNPGRITDVKSNLGLLYVESIIGNDVVITVIRGEKTQPLTLPPLPASGYVPAKPLNLTKLSDGVEVRPIAIGNPDPNQVNSYATSPVFRIVFKFPQTRGKRIMLRTREVYIDDTRSTPGNRNVWACSPTWQLPVTRKNIVPVMGSPLASYNPGRIPSSLIDVDYDVTDYFNRTNGDTAIAIGATEPPYFAQSGHVIIASSVRLIVSNDGEVVAQPTPEPPVIIPPPAPFSVTIPATQFSANTAAAGLAWVATASGERMTSSTNAGVNLAAGGGPRLDYRITVPAAGAYVVSVRGFGATKTDDSAWLSIDGGAAVQVGDFSATGATIGTTAQLGAGEHVVGVGMREDGAAVESVIVTTK